MALRSLKSKFFSAPRYLDVFLLAVFTLLITLKPHFAHGKINLFEVGLYLPGIQSILDGEVLFRDIFHLRGPFELYLPALLMRMFGNHLTVLYAYFYFGNVLCLILCALIAKEIFRTRGLLYLMVPVLIGRAFPRVVFTYWGGMRYAWGLLSVWFVIKFFKTDKLRWMFGAGLVSGVAGLTSIEMGAYPFLGLLAAMTIAMPAGVIKPKKVFKSLGVYILGAACVVVPFGTYLFVNGALFPYFDAVWTIVTRMQVVIDPHFVSVYPRNFPEAFVAMTNPGHTNFKHMTPSYLYIFILVYLFLRLKKRVFSKNDLILICLGVYGFIMYNTGFRGIWAAQFEMALQPEKVLLFFLYEALLLIAVEKKPKLIEKLKTRRSVKWYSRDKWKIYLINGYIFILIASSIGYSVQRFNHRFYAFQFLRDKILGRDTSALLPHTGETSRALTIDRAKGIIVPADQAEEVEQVVAFLQQNTGRDEEVFTYPDLGTYNFLADRRGFGRFPLATFAWFQDRWHEDYMEDLKSSGPRYMIVQKEIPQGWKDVYLALEPNRQKFRDVMNMISSDYSIVRETPLSYIYRRNDAVE